MIVDLLIRPSSLCPSRGTLIHCHPACCGSMGPQTGIYILNPEFRLARTPGGVQTRSSSPVLNPKGFPPRRNGLVLPHVGINTNSCPSQSRNRNLLRCAVGLSGWRRQCRDPPQHAGNQPPALSRLARSSADLQRLLELCALTDTLIIDGDGVYDLGSFNDRLLLGLKGTMSEAELHLLAGRLQGAKLAAAQRGELRFVLPVGYVYDDEGRPVIDPDEEVRAAVAEVFASFEAKGSAYGVVAAFAERRFPTRPYGGVWAGQIRWGRLRHRRVLGLLSNPAYAGAYVFGRYRSRRVVDPDGTIRTKTAALPREQWQVLIRDHHPAYITWESFVANANRLAANCTCQGARSAREGGALLQGIVVCGGCGRLMSTMYQGRKPSYDLLAQPLRPRCDAPVSFGHRRGG
jgi:hypothetical protein